MSSSTPADKAGIKLYPAKHHDLHDVTENLATVMTLSLGLEAPGTILDDSNHSPKTAVTNGDAFTTLDPETARPSKKRRRSNDLIAGSDHGSNTDRSNCSSEVDPALSDSPKPEPLLHESTPPTTTPSSSPDPDSGNSGCSSSMTGCSPLSNLNNGVPFKSGLVAAEAELIAKIRPEMARLYQEIEDHKAHRQPVLYDSFGRLRQSLDDDDLFAQFETDPHPASEDQAFPAGKFQSLLMSKEDLGAATSDGRSVHRRYTVIKIPGTAQDEPDLHREFDGFRRRVRFALSDSQFQYQNYEGQKIGRMNGSELFKILDGDTPTPKQTHDAPKNFLSLSGFTLHDSLEPSALRQLGFDLLKDLLMRIRSKFQKIDGSSDPAGKEQRKVYYLSDLEACLSFLLYGQRGSLSMWHMDILNGTWVRCVSGIKLWFVYTGPFDEEAKEAFAKWGTHWTPPKGTVKCYVLKPGDTLIMRPGYPIAHSVISLEDSLMTGGMMWPRSGIAPVLENLSYIMTHPRVTNEDIPRQLPNFLNELQLLMRENPSPRDYTFTDEDKKAVDNLKDLLYPKFSCAAKCVGGCKASCPCLAKSDDKNPGCSVWCHSSFALNPDDGCTKTLRCNCQGTCKKCACAKASRPCGDLCHKCTCGNKTKNMECTETCLRHPTNENCKNMKKVEQGEMGMKATPSESLGDI
ncbi:hypothetical protein BDV96DRAFT_562796 [Lophiotrema nucula]|uniref:JmjC domain-containing protein n=1 Tax=Lophiotrema nucula TaxID=690887 RepID=A0A6A5ZSH0_9PLEO|nr:hypothetical protein BDV96DRAFT_562796 [Lophiotrema nucula]